MMQSNGVIIRNETQTLSQRVSDQSIPKEFSINKRALKVKRIIDILGSIIGVILLGLIYPFIAIGIKIASRGPVIFSQKRIGLNGKEFMCYKFRTMHLHRKNQDTEKPNVTKKEDDRIFDFGRFLRKNNLDELPQLINVLKGEMSLVGPRPLMTVECEYWNEQIPNFELRTLMKPGLSGWAQVNGYRGGTLDCGHMAQRLKRDITYIKHFSPLLDTKIIIKTVMQMIHFDTNAH